MAYTSEHIKKRLIDALRKSLGVVKTACEEVEISRTTFYEYMKNDPDFKAEVESLQDESVDVAESALFDQIKNGNITAIIFYLKTKGKKRGYTERQEIEQVGDQKVFRIEMVGDDHDPTE